jgi:dTDP-4-dehydrorhamnose reductase
MNSHSKKILVLGASGMAGHIIHGYLSEIGHSVTGADLRPSPHASIRIADFRVKEDLTRILGSQHWDAVINAVGVLNQFVDANPADGIFLNSILPHFLATYFRDSQTKLLHMSTDCVFSGKRGLYTERDFRDGDSLYDRSKALGEIVNSKDLTLRQSIIGPDTSSAGIGLFNWFMQATPPLKGFKNALWNGVTTLQLAKGMNAVLDLNLTGLYHHVTPGTISKSDLLVLFSRYFRPDTRIIPTELTETINKTLVNTNPLDALIVPDYSTQLAEMRLWIENHKGWYPHYNFS